MILLFSKVDSIWTKEYVKEILTKCNTNIYIICDNLCSNELKKEYMNMGVNVLERKCKSKLISRIPKISTFVGTVSSVKKLKEKNKLIDIIELQGMPYNFSGIILYSYIVRFGEMIICNYWGSDLLATSNKILKFERFILSKAKYIVLQTEQMKRTFNSIFKNKYINKERNFMLGASIFDNIKIVMDTMTREACKMHFNIDPDKIVIEVGYNGAKRQQHMQVLCSINRLTTEMKNKICIVLHYGYGCNDENYLKKVKCYIKDNFPCYKFIDKYLGKEDTAILRYATDIMIHAQVSDAFAASIRELLCAGGILLNPTWVKYYEYDQVGIDYYIYEDWDELYYKLNEMLNNISEFKSDKNSNLVYEHFSWKANSEKWIELHI